MLESSRALVSCFGHTGDAAAAAAAAAGADPMVGPPTGQALVLRDAAMTAVTAARIGAAHVALVSDATALPLRFAQPLKRNAIGHGL